MGNTVTTSFSFSFSFLFLFRIYLTIIRKSVLVVFFFVDLRVVPGYRDLTVVFWIVGREKGREGDEEWKGDFKRG